MSLDRVLSCPDPLGSLPLAAASGRFHGRPTMQVRTLAAPPFHHPSLARHGRSFYGSRYRAILICGCISGHERAPGELGEPHILA